MGSIYVTWEGTCPDHSIQDDLICSVNELARHSVDRLSGPKTVRPAILEVMDAQRTENMPTIDPIRTFDQTITGRIILDPCLVRDGQALYDDVQNSSVEQVTLGAGETDKNEAFCFNINTSNAQIGLVLPELRIRGVDFQLFDPRGLYPNANRVSFVFLESHDLPSLNGCVAQIETHDQCHAYGGEQIRAADWYVCAPNIHLRYYLEDWMDYFLGYVKYFYIPDFYFHRYEPMSQYDAFESQLNEAGQTSDRDLLKQAVLNTLISKFEAEADEWCQKLTGWATP